MKQLFLIFTLCALPFLVLPQDTTFTSEPIETGFVFIDGKYIEPPYVVEVKDKSILINKIKATEIINSDEKFKFSISSLPEIPNSLNKESSFEDIFKAINPITKRLYINEIFVYAYTNFNFNDALKVQLNYYKNLPNVKSIERKPDSNTWWVIETFDGKKNKAIIGGPEAEYFYKNYGQESDNLKIDKLLVLKTITAAKNIKQKLKESDLVFLFSNELYNYNLPKKTGFSKLFKLYKIINSQQEDSRKINAIDSLYLFQKPDAIYYLKQFINNKTLLKRIEILINDGIIKNEESNYWYKNTNQNFKTKLEVEKNNNICYSPSIKKIKMWCPDPWSPRFTGFLSSFTFNDIKNSIINNVASLGFSDVEIFTDSQPNDQTYGNLTYQNLINLCQAGIMAINSHGNNTDIFILYFNNTSDFIQNWIGQNNCDGLDWGPSGDMNGWSTNNVYPYVLTIQKQWVQNNWQEDLNNNKTLSIVMSCNNATGEDNILSAFGGFAFGYENFSDVDGHYKNNQKLLKKLNGTNGNGQYRTTLKAYNNDIYLNNFTYHNGINTDLTLCPGIKEIFPKSGDPCNATGTGFVEFDTWVQKIDLSVNPAITFSTTGNVTVENLRWDEASCDGDKASKLMFDWQGLGDFTITPTIQHQLIQSWNNNTGPGHFLDADNKAPNNQNKTYTFSHSMANPLDFTHQRSGIMKISFEGFLTADNVVVNSYEWDFGDGNIQTTTNSAVEHTYSNCGVYNVCLTANTNLGLFAKNKNVFVIDESIPTELGLSCYVTPQGANTNEWLEITGSIISGYDQENDYTMIFEILNINGDQIFIEDAFMSANTGTTGLFINQSGLYMLNVFAVDNNNEEMWGLCQTNFYITNPNPCEDFHVDFNTDNDTYSPGSTITFTDATSGGLQPYKYWRWDFMADPVSMGQPIMPTKFISGFPFNDNGSTTNRYYDEGIYQVMLTVEDADYCTASKVKTITIAEPQSSYNENCYPNFRVQSRFSNTDHSPRLLFPTKMLLQELVVDTTYMPLMILMRIKG